MNSIVVLWKGRESLLRPGISVFHNPGFIAESVTLLNAKARSSNDIRRSMTDKTGIISLSHVQFSNGFRIDLDEVGNNKGRHTLVVNASQSAGVFEIDVKRMKIDALCSTGHKWMLSGYGSGFVYLNRELQAASKPRPLAGSVFRNPYAIGTTRLPALRCCRPSEPLSHFAGIFAHRIVSGSSMGIGMSRPGTRSNPLLTPTDR